MLGSAFIGGLALLVAAQAPPEQELTLQAAVHEALAHNPELAQAEATARADAAQARGAGAWPEPMLSYQAWQQPLSRPLDPTATDMHMFGVRQTLPPWGQPGRAAGAAEAGAKASAADARAGRLQLEAQVAHGLVAYWLMRQELAAHEAHVMLGQRTLGAIKARYVAGQATQAEMLRAETELHRLHSSIEGLRQSLRGATAYLNAAMGRPPEAPVPPPAEPERALPATGGTTRPELVAAEQRAVQAHAAAELARGERALPEVMVGLDYMLSPGRPGAYSLMVQVPLPFVSGRRAAEVESATQHARAAELGKAAAENVARYEADEARARAAAAQAQLDVLEQHQAPASERALEATQASYAGGQADLASLLDAQSAVLDARLSLARQQAALGDAIADLRRALGIDLFPHEQP